MAVEPVNRQSHRDARSLVLTNARPAQPAALDLVCNITKTASIEAAFAPETCVMVPKVGLEPTRDILPPVFETGASTIPPLRPDVFSIARLRIGPVAL